MTGWYFLAAQYIQGTDIEVAFVSTNSISQGEQVGVLWKELFGRGVIINFAHRTFQWNSEARGKAAVHCVIIGFSLNNRKDKKIFEYDDIRSEPHELKVSNINGYLVDGPSVLIGGRRKPICDVPVMKFGNQPNDGGGFILSEEEKKEFEIEEPTSLKYIRKYVGSREFINNLTRWCLWLKDIQPNELRQSKKILERVNIVKKHRLLSKRPATVALAETPTIFGFISHSESEYIIVPSVSSERRKFIPIGFMSSKVITSNLCLIVPGAAIYHFGIMSSTMHMAWMRYTAGRLKSDYRYSIGLVYNNYPWPENITAKQTIAVEQAAQAVLDARTAFPDSTLADLYDPLTMPVELTKAHARLDKAVDKCYRSQPFSNELNRMQFMFTLYEAKILV